MLQFVLIQLLNQAALRFLAEHDGNNNPKLARMRHFSCSYHESGAINESLEWEKELCFKCK